MPGSKGDRKLYELIKREKMKKRIGQQRSHGSLDGVDSLESKVFMVARSILDLRQQAKFSGPGPGQSQPLLVAD
jgi:hypothetical protein